MLEKRGVISIGEFKAVYAGVFVLSALLEVSEILRIILKGG